MLNIISHQRNANEDHNELLLHGEAEAVRICKAESWRGESFAEKELQKSAEESKSLAEYKSEHA